VLVKTFILIQAEPRSVVAAVVAGVAAIPGVDWAEAVRGPFDVIAQATTDVDLVSVMAVSGVLHALASPTIEPVNAA
jgi:hypothetical protein